MTDDRLIATMNVLIRTMLLLMFAPHLCAHAHARRIRQARGLLDLPARFQWQDQYQKSYSFHRFERSSNSHSHNEFALPVPDRTNRTPA